MNVGKIGLKVIEYEASGGKEFFISAEDNKGVLVGFCRLRFVPRSLRPEIIKGSAIVRELHVYGASVGVGQKAEGRSQHTGWGKRLLEKAEEIAMTGRQKKMLVISGIGVREYYRKLGYRREGPYMVKKLKSKP